MWSTSYRLGELKITESDGGEVWWESHYGLGSCREGRCYKQGEVLFIGPSQTETLGFLKGEFLDSIRSLPPWTKTKYHCKLPTVYHCGSGKRVSDEENPLFRAGRKHRRPEPEGRGDFDSPFSNASPGYIRETPSYRIEHYRLAANRYGPVTWRSYTDRNTVREGTCVVLGDILLFKKSDSEQEGLLKQEFYDELNELPTWNLTTYYALNVDLMCSSEGRTGYPPPSVPGKGRRAPEAENLSERRFPGLNSIPYTQKIRTYSARAGEMKVLSTAVQALSDRVIATGKALSMNCWKKVKERWLDR